MTITSICASIDQIRSTIGSLSFGASVYCFSSIDNCEVTFPYLQKLELGFVLNDMTGLTE